MNKKEILEEFIEKDNEQDQFGVIGAKLVKDYEDTEIDYLESEESYSENGNCYFYWLYKNVLILKKHIVEDGESVDIQYSIVEDYESFIENEEDREAIKPLLIAQKLEKFG